MKRISLLIVTLFMAAGGFLSAQQPAETQIFDDFLDGASDVVTAALPLSESEPPAVQVEPLSVNGYPGFYGAYVARRFEEVLLSSREASRLQVLDGGVADYRIQLSGALFPTEISLMVRLVESGSTAVIALKEFTYPRTEVWEQMLLADSAGAVPSLAPDSFEPNDSFDQAREIALDQYVEHRLTLTGGNHDYFKFHVSEEQVENALEIILETRSEMDTKVALYHESDLYSALIQDDDSGSGNNGRISFEAQQPGMHYLVVEGYSSDTEGSYTLFWEQRIPPRDEFEPDDEWNQGALLPLDESVQNHLFSSSGDIDWVIVQIPEGSENMQILTVQTRGNQDTLLALYNQELQEIASNDDSGEQGRNALISLPVSSGGTYYLKVSAYSLSSGSRGEYGLTGRLTEMPADSFEEIDNEAGTAPLIRSGELSSGRRLSYEHDYDWFRFTLEEPGQVTVRTRGNTDTRMGIFKTADFEELLAEDDDSGDGNNALIEVYLPAGTFYGVVCVSGGYYQENNNSYDLIMEVSQP